MRPKGTLKCHHCCFEWPPKLDAAMLPGSFARFFPVLLHVVLEKKPAVINLHVLLLLRSLPHPLPQVLKWALLASAQETSSLLIEKGKRDATAWFESMELGPLVTASAQQQPQQQQQQQQQQGGVILGSSNSSGGGRGEQRDWADEKGHEREREAGQAQQKTEEAERETEGMRGGDPLPRGVVEELLQTASAAGDVATDGGPDRAAVKHAAEIDVAGVVGPPNKRHKAAAAAATVAAVGKAAADGVGSLLGKDGKAEREE